MIIKEEDYLEHYGVLRRSGRYPWGSGGPEYANNKDFLGMVEGLKKQGMSEKQIAIAIGATITELRAAKSIARSEQKASDIAFAQRLHDKGVSNVAIGKQMQIGESSVRALLAPGEQYKADILKATANMLKDQVAKKGMIDVGIGVERDPKLGLSKERLATAVAILREEGYELIPVQIPQLGTSGNKKTTTKVLAPPGTTYAYVKQNQDKIGSINEYTNDGGLSYAGVKPPIHIDSSRVAVRYGDQGGSDADGVIYVRPGVKDVSLGTAHYAQVRISVNGTHYLKGMALYRDDLPAGVDLLFNTNKKSTGNKLDAMKKQKDDKDNPFGSVFHQISDEHGNVSSVMNLVNEEGDWDEWSRNLSSQFLSKQSPSLAKSQLDMTYERKVQKLEELKSLTNPTVRKKLLETYADEVDSSAVHLKAAALPRQRTQVLLPLTEMKENEIYAPNFRPGEKVVLVRYPHGGTFEIPELTVNNRVPSAKKALGQAQDAVGVHPKVAERLSGADFDGDTVLVIPNNSGKVKTSPPLKALENYDPKHEYPKYDGMPVMTERQKGREMGNISNLITDMTIKGAPASELARAVRHSMVVIDAEKHELNYKQSALDNNIASLKQKYQGTASGGAATLISRARSREYVPDRRLRRASEGGPVNTATGEKVYTFTGATKTITTVSKRTGVVTTKEVPKTERSVKLAETTNAHTLSSGQPIEKIYADHSNKLKDLANQARLAAVHTPPLKQSSSAKTVYAKEVASLNAKLNLALQNAPLERMAQLAANAVVSQKREANPDMEAAELKKIKGQALAKARIRTGAEKQRIKPNDDEWAAIQAGAISNHKLEEILNNADLEKIAELATPKTEIKMTSTKMQRAESMLADGYPQAEVADALGVSLSTLKRSLKGD